MGWLVILVSRILTSRLIGLVIGVWCIIFLIGIFSGWWSISNG